MSIDLKGSYANFIGQLEKEEYDKVPEAAAKRANKIALNAYILCGEKKLRESGRVAVVTDKIPSEIPRKILDFLPVQLEGKHLTGRVLYERTRRVEREQLEQLVDYIISKCANAAAKGDDYYTFWTKDDWCMNSAFARTLSRNEDPPHNNWYRHPSLKTRLAELGYFWEPREKECTIGWLPGP